MDILELANYKSVKELKQALGEMAVAFTNKYGIVRFQYPFFDILFNVQVRHAKDKIGSVSLLVQQAEQPYLEIAESVLKIREEMILTLGPSKLDNTNHLNLDNIRVRFEKENVSFSLYCSHEEECAGINVAAVPKTLPKNNIAGALLLWTVISLIAGLLWGGIMYALSKDYSAESLKIWMIGGLAFGVLFGDGLFVTDRIVKRAGANNYRRLMRIFDLPESSEIYRANSICIGKHKCSSVPVLLQISGSQVIMYMFIKKPYSHAISLEQACRGLVFGDLEVEAGNTVVKGFFFTEDSEKEKMEEKLFSQVIDNKKYSALFALLKKETVAYDPYSIYNSGGDGVLDKEIGRITNALLLEDDFSKESIRTVFFYPVIEDEYTFGQLSDLYRKAYAEFKAAQS